jgi:hypothetical protein
MGRWVPVQLLKVRHERSGCWQLVARGVAWLQGRCKTMAGLLGTVNRGEKGCSTNLCCVLALLSGQQAVQAAVPAEPWRRPEQEYII